MGFQTFERKCSPRGETSTPSSSLTVLAIVAAALVAGASIGGTHADGASASVRSIPTARTRLSDVQPASASPFTTEWDGSPDWAVERTDDPRECDIERGISVACIFMD
jgi:hypothetical protein